jgi:hypothetical protein
VDFTREPIIETVITPREGYRLVVRSSKNIAQEEHFVEALEVVSFGSALFFRSKERPKPFIVPVGDYEILEVREAKMVLKTPSFEKTVPAPREAAQKSRQEQKAEAKAEAAIEGEKKEAEPAGALAQAEGRSERRRDRRRSFRRKRGQAREEAGEAPPTAAPSPEELVGVGKEAAISKPEEEQKEKILSTAPLLSTILPPPTTLIREHLEVLRKQPAYKDAFYREAGSDFADDEDTIIEQLRSGDEKKEFELGDQEVSQHEPFRDSYSDESAPELFEKDKIVDSTDLEPKIP